jgi:putative transcriptional regulator
MESLADRLLIARPAMGDPNFDQTIIYVLEHTEDGALGVVVNRATETTVDEHLPELADMVSSPGVFFVGGPVGSEHVLGVGRVGGSMKSIDLEALIDGEIDEPDGLRLFAGYSGWGPGQLEGEMASDSWFSVEAFDGDIFGASPDDLWRDVLRRPGGAVGRLSLYPDQPLMT